MTDLPVDSKTSIDPLFEQLLEELAERIREGKSIEVEQYATRFPDQADRLRRLVASMEMLANFGDSSVAREKVITSSPNDDGMPSGVLGDYRILRELGRGGMGVVYEAEQISLGRNVALKILPLAAMMDERQLQRFKNEARAAATLNHANIVSIISVGRERGVHYYAMQLIEGQSMDNVIADLRRLSDGGAEKTGSSVGQLALDLTEGHAEASHSPLRNADVTSAFTAGQQPSRQHETKVETRLGPQAGISTEQSTSGAPFFRSAALLGIQAAKALDHAHSLGILHRDIKPANLMIDRQGHLAITDFGLARIESDAGMTMTGDMLGTLRYMSPEQALAKRVVVDHRSDIYSLGVTLYELMTLQPAFLGADRQELLRHIAFEEPKTPRRINSSIPEDLQTIVLKAIEKNPADRYSTAADLAADLQRFLNDRPIQAKPTSVVGHAIKWSRRHRAVVWSGVLAMAISSVVLAVSTFLLLRGFQRESALRKEADNQRLQTEESVALAREVIHEFGAREAYWLLDEADSPYRNTATIKEMKQVLTKAAEFYAALPRHAGNRQEITIESMKIQGYLAMIDLSLGERDLAINKLEPVVEFYRTLAEADESVENKGYLAKSISALAHVYGKGRRTESIQLCRESASLYLEMGDASSAIGQILGEASLTKDEAEPLYREAIELGKDEDEAAWSVGRARQALAHILRMTNRVEEAEDQMRLAEPLLRQMDAAKSGGHSLYVLGLFYQAWADIARQRGNVEVAIERAEESLRLLDRLVASFPDYSRGLGAQTGTLMTLGDLYYAHDANDRAIHFHRQAIEKSKRFPSLLFRTIVGHRALVYRLHELGKLDAEARQDFLNTIEMARASEDPNAWAAAARALINTVDADLRDVDAGLVLAARAVQADPENRTFWNTMGVAQYRAGEYASAITSLGKALDPNGGVPSDFFFLAMANHRNGEPDKAKRWYDKAVDWMNEHDELENPKLMQYRAEADELIGADVKTEE